MPSAGAIRHRSRTRGPVKGSSGLRGRTRLQCRRQPREGPPTPSGTAHGSRSGKSPAGGQSPFQVLVPCAVARGGCPVELVRLRQHPAYRVHFDLQGHVPSSAGTLFPEARATVKDLQEGFRSCDLRHYFASLLIAQELDVKVVQKSLRHSSAKTTLDTYGHMWPDKEESARAAVARVLGERLNPQTEKRE